MGNMKNANQVTVVVAIPEVPGSTVGTLLGQLYKGNSYWESGTYDMCNDAGRVYEVVKDDDIPDDQLQDVMNCLDDHWNNTVLEEWLETSGDILIDEEEGLWVEVKDGNYFGPHNTVVRVFFITI